MSLLPAYFGARRRSADVAPIPEPDEDMRADVFHLIPPRAEALEQPNATDTLVLTELTLAERLERLQAKLPMPVPPPEVVAIPVVSEALPELETHFELATPELAALEAARPVEPEAPPPTGRTALPAGSIDFTRLSIDNYGQLFWDGKPVEVKRRVAMSPAQILAASLLAVFIVIGAVGAAIQGSAVAHEWACKLGWISSYCGGGPPTPAPAPLPPARTDIPA